VVKASPAFGKGHGERDGFCGDPEARRVTKTETAPKGRVYVGEGWRIRDSNSYGLVGSGPTRWAESRFHVQIRVAHRIQVVAVRRFGDKMVAIWSPVAGRGAPARGSRTIACVMRVLLPLCPQPSEGGEGCHRPCGPLVQGGRQELLLRHDYASSRAGRNVPATAKPSRYSSCYGRKASPNSGAL